MKRLSIALSVVLLASACASTAPREKTPEDYLLEGEKQLEKGHYDEAIKALEKVRESYHSPEMTALAELKIADAYYRAEDYVEAAAAYEDFLKQHPAHPQTPEVLYRLGMSYFNQILAKDRDQTATRSALVTFESLVDRFPNHPLSAKAEPKIQEALDQLAAHEHYVGHFYLRTGHPNAAVERLVAIPGDFPSYPQLDEVYFHLGKAYMEIGETQRAEETVSLLLQEFPESKFNAEAKELLTEE